MLDITNLAINVDLKLSLTRLLSSLRKERFLQVIGVIYCSENKLLSVTLALALQPLPSAHHRGTLFLFHESTCI